MEQTWVIHFKDGAAATVVTPLGHNPLQAVQRAGLGEWEVASIVAQGIALVDDIAAWRRGEA